MTASHTVANATAEGYHTPNADAPLRIFLALNLRDSMTEDNVRKRPITSKIDPHALAGNPSLCAATAQDCRRKMQNNIKETKIPNFVGGFCKNGLK